MVVTKIEDTALLNGEPFTSDEGVFNTDEGDTLSLEFTTSGSPPPDVMWKRGSDILTSGDDVFISTSKGPYETTSTIAFRKLDAADSGTYSAEADNGEGTVASSSVEIDVRGIVVCGIRSLLDS